MWTTSRTTRETGRSSATGAIWKACATPAIAERLRGNCGKPVHKSGAGDRQICGSFGRRRVPEARAGILADPPPGVKKFWESRRRPQAHLRRRFFPHRRSGDGCVRIGHGDARGNTRNVCSAGKPLLLSSGGEQTREKGERQMLCSLKGSLEYCRTGRGICCASCPDLAGCEKACLNAPDRCGYAQDAPVSCLAPVPRPWKGGMRHGR